ncbi:hypothetical protein [Actinomadura sp. BRA 177]|uniref:hypothetical protein n=1 Tax=Actinomadura sp. BRA 177 TaxID=2745202 RepID=UPI001595F5AE|nr:hypothetical protein [Actinomadura sp. BRA 177]NVI91466.1 hypothetical protein [Actinomadura sp. BRA 177]
MSTVNSKLKELRTRTSQERRDRLEREIAHLKGQKKALEDQIDRLLNRLEDAPLQRIDILKDGKHSRQTRSVMGGCFG